MTVRRFEVEKLHIEIHPDSQSAGRAAAECAGRYLREMARRSSQIGVVFATGTSQMEMLSHLTSLPDIPWKQIHGFHLDEYVGLPLSHPASFRRYLREQLVDRVPIGAFHEIDGNAENGERMCAEYASALRNAAPQLCLLGIGENGHLAFNDPHEAEFDDPLDMKQVYLDSNCHQQQLAEGWFSSLEEIPRSAYTLTIPTILRIPKLVITVPGMRKSEAVRRTFQDQVSTACPSTVLRSHPDATVYLDEDSASGLTPSVRWV
jgi:glucosamine-6-phosphate deaminase